MSTTTSSAPRLDRHTWSLFEDWCTAHDQPVLSARPEALARFLSAHPAAPASMTCRAGKHDPLTSTTIGYRSSRISRRLVATLLSWRRRVLWLPITNAFGVVITVYGFGLDAGASSSGAFLFTPLMIGPGIILGPVIGLIAILPRSRLIV